MILPAEVRHRLQEERGLYATEACDSCRKLLSPVRFTRRGNEGVRTAPRSASNR